MKRKITQKVDAILTADWHLMEKQPICRTDDFWETQWEKINFISELAQSHNCPVIHAGDLLDHWKPSPMLLSKAFKHLPQRFWTVYGNHDLPLHNLDLAYKSGANTLHEAGRINIFNGCHWGQNPIEFSGFYIKERLMLPWHVMAYQGKKPFPGCTAPTSAKLLRKYPQFDLIVTGDNHAPFVEQYEGRLLVNPGSIFRLTAAQIFHKPRVYLYYEKTNTVKPVYLPIENEVVNRDHLGIQELRTHRINTFVENLETNWKKELSFKDNLLEFCEENKIRNSVKNIILKSIEYEKD